DFAVARLYGSGLQPGALDTSFNGNGKAVIAFGNGSNDAERATSVTVQPDNGNIVVAGYATSTGSGYDFAIARLIGTGPKAGTLDGAFNGTGLEKVNFGGHDEANAVVLQADDKIIAAGTTDGDFAVARLNTNGSLDATFSGDGEQTINFQYGDVAT